jgi:glutamate formiminotransferase/formiminotetrahydrofolate cyclodeaminase
MVAGGFQPDYGPSEPHPTAGAIVVGARNLLVAFNVHLDTTRVDLAQRIAERIRQKSAQGRKLPGVRALGWWMPEYGHAQVTCNVTDLDACGLLEVFEACTEEASLLRVRVTGSELIGLVPEKELARVGATLLSREGTDPDNEDAPLERAIRFLALSSKRPFVVEQRVLERALKNEPHLGLTQSSIAEFLGLLSSSAPVPGGGGVAALVGALGFALGEMVLNLTKLEDLPESTRLELRGTALALPLLREEFLRAVDCDGLAFLNYLAVLKRPREELGRKQALKDAAFAAAEAPLRTIELAQTLLGYASILVTYGNPHARSDAVSGALLAQATASIGLCQVEINLSGRIDVESQEALARARAIEQEIRAQAQSLLRPGAGPIKKAPETHS